MLVSHLSPLDTTYQVLSQGTAQAFVNHGSSPADAAQQAQAVVYGMVQQHAAMLAFIDDFWVFGLLCLAIIPLALAMKSVQVHKGNRSVRQVG